MATDTDRLLELRSYLTARSVAELDQLATFWLEPGREHGEPAETRLALTEAMTDRETVAGKVSYLLHEDRQLIRQLVNQRGHRANRDQLLVRPVGAVAPDPRLLEGSLERLRDRGFVELARVSAWGGRTEIEVRVPRELAEELQGVLGGDVRPIDRYMSCAAYLRNLSHNQLEEKLSRVSRAGGREEQIKRAIARCRSSSEVERRRERLPPELAETVALVRDEFHGLAFREEIQAVRPDLTVTWDESDWRDALERALLGTVGMFSLVDHGLRRHGEAMVVFSEAVSAARRKSDADSDRSEPELAFDLAYDFLSLIDRLLALVQTESVKVTQKDRLLFKGTRRRLLEAFTDGREAELYDAEFVVDWAVRFAGREGLVDTDDLQRLCVRPEGLEWMQLSVVDRLRRVLRTTLGEIVAISRAPISSDFVLGVVGGLSSERWAEATRFHRRFRSMLASLKLPDGRSHHLQGARVGDPEDGSGGGTELDDVAGLVEGFLVPFYLSGCLQLGAGAAEPRTITHLRLSPVARGIFADELREELGDDDRLLLINPDCEVMVFPPAAGDARAFHTRLERCADLRGGEGIRRYHLSGDSVRRAVVLGDTGEGILEMLGRRARAPLPGNVEYSVREWAASIEFVPAALRVLLHTASHETAERIVMLAATRGIQADLVGDTHVSLPGDALDDTGGPGLREALRDAGVLVTEAGERENGTRPGGE